MDTGGQIAGIGCKAYNMRCGTGDNSVTVIKGGRDKMVVRIV